MLNTNYLLDKDFLKKLDDQQEREIYAKVILLTFDEHPIQEIQGKISQGSVNVDGASAVRRTCSFTLLAEDINISDYYWGMKDKFKLEVGMANKIDSRYPDIIWFPQGVFVATSFNQSITTTGYTYSISGKDKMCLLNGDLGGSLPFSVDFGKVEEERYSETEFIPVVLSKETYVSGKYYEKKDDGHYGICMDIYFDEERTYYERALIVEFTQIPIYQIIQNAVSVYGKERKDKIIINDIDKYGVEVLEYRGDTPIYFPCMGGTETNVIFNQDHIFYNEAGEAVKVSDKSLVYEPLMSRVNSKSGTILYPTLDAVGQKDKEMTVAKVEYGELAGYRRTDLTYPGDLIANIGETLTSILDKIKNMLGDFEYFYDLDGNFVFQEKKAYVNTSWNSIVNTEDDMYVEDSAYSNSWVYSFENNNRLTAFQNNPAINNLKNDYAIWGKRKSNVSGEEIPIHMRYAIDFKPTFYRSIEVTEEDIAKCKKSFLKPQPHKIYLSKEFVDEKNEYAALPRYDWRELIYQMAKDYFAYHAYLHDFQEKVAEANYDYYPLGTTGYEIYYTDMEGFWRELYDPEVPNAEYNGDGWNVNVDTHPELLNFWFDFIDADSELGKFAIPLIGDRPKAVNDNDVKAIYFRDIPQVMFGTSDQFTEMVTEMDMMTGYTFITLQPYLENYFTIGSQGKSAQDTLDSLLYQHTYCTDNVTITAVPVYYLQPNTRILVKDDKTGINGEYLVSKLTIPLAYNGTMSITASKAVTRIY